LALAWRREVLKTSVRALRSVAVTGREEGFNGNRNQQSSLSTMEPGKVEIGAEILLPIGREFGKSIEWLLGRLSFLSKFRAALIVQGIFASGG
jgi:hypothetical protein